MYYKIGDNVNQILYVKREEFGKYVERLADKRDGKEYGNNFLK